MNTGILVNTGILANTGIFVGTVIFVNTDIFVGMVIFVSVGIFGGTCIFRKHMYRIVVACAPRPGIKGSQRTGIFISHTSFGEFRNYQIGRASCRERV